MLLICCTLLAVFMTRSSNLQQFLHTVHMVNHRDKSVCLLFPQAEGFSDNPKTSDFIFMSHLLVLVRKLTNKNGESQFIVLKFIESYAVLQANKNRKKHLDPKQDNSALRTKERSCNTIIQSAKIEQNYAGRRRSKMDPKKRLVSQLYLLATHLKLGADISLEKIKSTNM